MTQFRRVGTSGRLVFASAAIVALSFLGYGNTAVASAPLAAGAEPAPDLTAQDTTGAATATDVSTFSSDKGRDKSTGAGKSGKVVEKGCRVDAPTSTPPDAPAVPTKDDNRPAVSAQNDPSVGVGSAPGVGVQNKKPSRPVRPAIPTPELREGPNGVKRFAPSAAGGCSVPEPVDVPPIMGRPSGVTPTFVDDRPTVCPDPAPALPKGSGGGSSAEPNPGSVEPDGQPEDQPASDSAPSCVQPDSPVSNEGDPGPAVDLPAVAGDDVAAREAGVARSSR
jgi:hypothetical protein